jgi:hypothetical protein
MCAVLPGRIPAVPSGTCAWTARSTCRKAWSSSAAAATTSSTVSTAWPRVVAGDLAVRKAVGVLYGLDAVPGEPQTRQLTAHWGDAATVAQQLALAAAAGGSA